MGKLKQIYGIMTNLILCNITFCYRDETNNLHTTIGTILFLLRETNVVLIIYVSKCYNCYIIIDTI